MTHTLYQTHTKAALEHFTSLTAQARRLLFPPAARSERDPLPKPWWKKVVLFLMRSPSLEYGDDVSWIFLSTGVWYIISQIWITFGLNALGIPWLISITTHPVSGSATTTTSLWLVILVFLVVLIALVAIPLSYAGVVDFWRDTDRTVKERVLHTLFFLTVLVLITIFWLYPDIPQQQVRQHILRVLGVYFGFLVPSIIVLYRLLVASLRLFRPLLFIILAHQPFQQKTINTLVLESIPAPDDTHWLLRDLEIVEIRLLREWAQANRDTTEKQLLPTTIFLFGVLSLVIGVLDIFSDAELFNNAVQTVLPWIQQALSAENLLLNLLLNLLVISVLWWSWVLFNLLANLIVQGVIIETCIVAEYAYARTTRAEATAIEDKPDFWLNLWWRR